MIINNNMLAINSHRHLGKNTSAQAKSMEKLSSGMRINRAGDDAAGLAISEKMRAQVRGLNQASRNAQDGISLIQTAEGALDETHAILQRMRELTVQAGNGTNATGDKQAIKQELDELSNEIKRIADSTEFNGMTLLSDESTSITFQVGANEGQVIGVTISSMNAAALTVEAKNLEVETAGQVEATLKNVDGALEAVSKARSGLGAKQNRLEHTIKNVNNASENLQAAESRIRDVDMAKEMMSLTKTNVLNQAAQSMLAQDNQQPNQVLQLLQ